MNEKQNGGTFADPLENYDPRIYGDSVEKALAEESVSRIQHQPHASIASDAAISEAISKLATEHVACLLVVDDRKLVGILTDREVMSKVALEPDQGDRPVREIMTEAPVYVYEDDPAAAALSVMAVSGYRHVPVVNAEGDAVGVISPQRVTRFLSKHF